MYVQSSRMETLGCEPGRWTGLGPVQGLGQALQGLKESTITSVYGKGSAVCVA